MVLLLFRGNILSSSFCQGCCVYFKTPTAAIHYIKWTGRVKSNSMSMSDRETTRSNTFFSLLPKYGLQLSFLL